MKVANEILRQLGGNRFVAMTGAKNLIAGTRSLSMRLPRNASKANYLRITLNGLDLYDVEFISIRGMNMKTKAAFTDVYNDMLTDIFESTTKMYTSLGTMGR